MPDNLNTHPLGSHSAGYPVEEVRQSEDHFTPEHSSWPNMAGRELTDQCPDRRPASRAAGAAAVGPWEAERDRVGVRLVWSFRVANTRQRVPI